MKMIFVLVNKLLGILHLISVGITLVGTCGMVPKMTMAAGTHEQEFGNAGA